MTGIDNRATIDIDTTVRNYYLSAEDSKKMTEEIISISLKDEVRFTIKSVESIMDEAEYPGTRLKPEAVLAEKAERMSLCLIGNISMLLHFPAL